MVKKASAKTRPRKPASVPILDVDVDPGIDGGAGESIPELPPPPRPSGPRPGHRLTKADARAVIADMEARVSIRLDPAGRQALAHFLTSAWLPPEANQVTLWAHMDLLIKIAEDRVMDPENGAMAAMWLSVFGGTGTVPESEPICLPPDQIEPLRLLLRQMETLGS